MNHKQIGLFLVVTSIVLALFFGFFRFQLVKSYENEIISLEDGVCEHTGEGCPFDKINRLLVPTVLFSSVLMIMFILGIYLIFFEKSEERWKETQKKLVQRISQVDKKKIQKEKQEAFFSGLDEKEKKVLLAIKEQDGIGQATLRIRVDYSKAMLSVVLKNLEKKEIVKKVPYKRTNRIYLRKKI